MVGYCSAEGTQHRHATMQTYSFLAVHLLHVFMDPEGCRVLSITSDNSCWCLRRLLAFFVIAASTVCVMYAVSLLSVYHNRRQWQGLLLWYGGSKCWPGSDLAPSRQYYVHGIPNFILLKEY